MRFWRTRRVAPFLLLWFRVACIRVRLSTTEPREYDSWCEHLTNIAHSARV